MPNGKYDLEIIVRSKSQGDGIKDAEKDVDNFGKKLNKTIDVVGKSTAAVAAAGVVFQQTYAAIGEGADLILARERLDKLAGTIDTTADALTGKLRAATGGMVSDAALVASASDIISLGLAKTEEQTIRLATASAKLGLDQQQLVLTFANNSKARLDALGLSVEGVTKTMEELQAQGFEGDAFDEAVLIGLEEKMTLLGDASESTAGKMQRLEAAQANLTNRFKEYLALQWEGPIGGLVNTMDAVEESTDKGRSGWLNAAIVLTEFTNEASIGGKLLREYVQEQKAASDESFQLANYTNDLANAYALANQNLKDSAAVAAQAEKYTNELANSYAAAGQAAVESSNNQLAAIEAARQHNALVTQGFKDAETPVQTLLQAQADLEAASGEWVQVTRTNANEVAGINEQLAGDLSDEQRKAYQEILNTADEGNADWLAAYNALQSDLTDSTRAGLIAQRAELEGQGPTLANVYTGDLAAAEEARAAIAAAEEAIRAEYRKTAAEAILARGGVTQANLDLLVSIGYLSQEEATMRLEFANTQTAIEELTSSQAFQTLTTEQQAVALNSLIAGQTATADAALNAANQMQLEGETVEELRNRLVETSGTYEASVQVDTSDAENRLNRLKTLIAEVSSGSVPFDSSTASRLAENAAGGIPPPPSRAFGGPVFAGSSYSVHPPEYFRTGSGNYLLTPGENGQIVSQAATQQALASTGSATGGVTIHGGIHINAQPGQNGRQLYDEFIKEAGRRSEIYQRTG